MARTHSDTDRETKRQSIVQVARGLFLELGFEGTSMGRIAQLTGVAPNTLYWYFADKDELLVAVLDAIFAEGAAHYRELKRKSLKTQLNWLLDRFASIDRLVTEIHARVQVSESARKWHAGFHALFERLVRDQLAASGVERRDLDHATHLAVFAIEGLISHPTSREERAAFIAWLTSRALRR